MACFRTPPQVSLNVPALDSSEYLNYLWPPLPALPHIHRCMLIPNLVHTLYTPSPEKKLAPHPHEKAFLNVHVEDYRKKYRRIFTIITVWVCGENRLDVKDVNIVSHQSAESHLNPE